MLEENKKINSENINNNSESQRIDLKSMLECELCDFVKSKGYPAFRGKQIFEWISKGVCSFDEMKNLPKNIREELERECTLSCAKIVRKLISKIDGTVKYLLEFDDGERVETVFMRYKHGNSVCVSTQVGCRMGCKFCASTIGGLVRGLKPSEILEQILVCIRDLNEDVSNIVLMGIGEPLDNYDNVLKFLKLVNEERGVCIGMRHISLSTCGLVDMIDRLKEEHLGITLSVSLHAPTDEIRKQIMPIANKWDIDSLLESCKRYSKETSRRISYEYAMISGVNDSEECASILAKKLKGTLAHVNLIPVNSVTETGFKKSSTETIKKFCEILEKNGVAVTVRRKLGSDINASCGQLRRGEVKRNSQ
jgi:23S rRNA (adenine2503-C2)-methyltransferase